MASVRRAAAREQDYWGKRDALRKRLSSCGGVADAWRKSGCGMAPQQASSAEVWDGGGRGDAGCPRPGRSHRVNAADLGDVSVVGPALVLATLSFTSRSKCRWGDPTTLSIRIPGYKVRAVACWPLMHPFLRWLLLISRRLLAPLAAGLIERGQDGA